MKMKDLVVNKSHQKQKKIKILITENQANMIIESLKTDLLKSNEFKLNEKNQR